MSAAAGPGGGDASAAGAVASPGGSGSPRAAPARGDRSAPAPGPVAAPGGSRSPRGAPAAAPWPPHRVRDGRDAEGYLTSLIRPAIKYDLAGFRELDVALDRPSARGPWLHIAGTNGKGSTSAMAEALLRAAGHPTTMFSSPHLVSMRERFRLDGVPVGGDAFAASTRRLAGAALAHEVSGGTRPTFFEGCAATAFLLRAARGGWGVAECGLGGRLDATNLVVPAAAAITTIGLDHTKTLGPTLRHIAVEKAGIAKPGVPIFVPADLPAAVAAALLAEVRRRGGRPRTVEVRATGVRLDPTRGVQRFDLIDPRGGDVPGVELSLLGPHQVSNACLAVALVRAGLARHGLALDAAAVRRGLAGVRWPGRFDRRRVGGVEVVLDAVHNPHGMRAFRRVWDALYGGTQATVLFGACGDKQLGGMFTGLDPLAARVVFTRAAVRRAAPAARLLQRWRARPGAAPAAAEPGVAAAFEAALADARRHGRPLLVCGSLYLLGEVFALSRGPGLG